MFSWTSLNPAAVVLWHQDQLLVLLPIQAQHPVQECKADNRTALILMGKESPQSVGAPVDPLTILLVGAEGLDCNPRRNCLHGAALSGSGTS